MKGFEVGKFYAICLYPTYGGEEKAKYISALCTRVMKRRVEFQYIYRHQNGTRKKAKVLRSLSPATEHCHASAYCADKHSFIPPTSADMEAGKPSKWDEVTEDS